MEQNNTPAVWISFNYVEILTGCLPNKSTTLFQNTNPLIYNKVVREKHVIEKKSFLPQGNAMRHIQKKVKSICACFTGFYIG
jgi:hypothetical protein